MNASQLLLGVCYHVVMVEQLCPINAHQSSHTYAQVTARSYAMGFEHSCIVQAEESASNEEVFGEQNLLALYVYLCNECECNHVRAQKNKSRDWFNLVGCSPTDLVRY